MQVKDNSLTKHKFRTYYEGSEVVVAGQLQPEAQELTPQVLAFCGVDDGVGKVRKLTPTFGGESVRRLVTGTRCAIHIVMCHEG